MSVARTIAQAHPMSEAELQTIVIRLAESKGWLVKPPDKANQGDGNRRAHRNGSAKGYPDLTLARDGEALWLELKAEDGKLTTEQAGWQLALPRMEVIRPSDLARGRVDELLA